MHIEFPDEGGVLIVGDEEELLGLASQARIACEDGESVFHILTDEGVEPVTMRRLVDEGGA